MKATGIFFLLVLLFVCVCLFDDCGKKSPVESKKPDLRYTDCPISPGGGTYPVGPDLVITVPEGAVQSDMTIQIAKLDQERMQEAFADFGIADFPAVAGFDVKPAGAEFSKPVTFTFKSVPYDAPYIPLTHTVDLSIGAHSIEQCVTLVDNDSDSLSVSVTRSGSYIVEALAGWPGLAKPSGVAGCREGVIQVECIDKDNYCTTQDCQITESSVKVQFLTCDGQPIESAIMREKSGGCIAALTLTPGASSIATNSSTSINAELKIGCAVAETPQTIALTVAGPATISPGSIATGTDGKASATLSSQDQAGTAVVTASADVRYAAREIIINGSVEESLYRIEEDVTAQTSVIVKDLPTWHVDLEINFDGGTSAWGESGNWSTVVQYSTHLEFDLKKDTTKPGMHAFEIPGTQNISIRQGDCPLVTLRSVEYAPSSTTFGISDSLSRNQIAIQFTSLSYQPTIYGIPAPCFGSDIINGCLFVDEDGNCIYHDVEQYIIMFCPLEESALFEQLFFVFPLDQNSYTASGALWSLAFADIDLDGEIGMLDIAVSLSSWGFSAGNTSYTLTVTKKESVAKLAGDAEQAVSSDTAKSKAWQNQLKRALQMAKKFDPEELKKLKEKGFPLPVRP